MRRHHLPEQPVHVIQRGNNRSKVFFGADDARAYLDWLTEAARGAGVSIHAYVLMANHIHLLATAATATALGRCMQSVGIRYTRYVNGQQQRTGTLWDGPYRAAAITDDAYFLACSRYIEMNPVRAGLAETPATWRWSSYRANAAGQSDPLITPHAIYLRLGDSPAARQSAYRDLCAEVLDDTTLATIRTATNQSGAISPHQMTTSRGRPRKI